jgi:hypothetical protein
MRGVTSSPTDKCDIRKLDIVTRLRFGRPGSIPIQTGSGAHQPPIQLVSGALP